MRNLSFALTTEQFRQRTKTVTRRKGTWWGSVLKTGTLLCGVEKSQGIKKGGLVRLGTIRVVSVGLEGLCVMSGYPSYGLSEARAEGFPELDGAGFVRMFCKHMRCTPYQIVTRIEFEYMGDNE